MSCANSELEGFQCDVCPDRSADVVDRCPARWFFQNFGDKWSLPVLGCLVGGPLRFSQFRRQLEPISERMLILTLKKLEEGGFIERAAERASLSTYKLTALGLSLLEHVGDLFQWMNSNAPAVLESYDRRSAPRGSRSSLR